MPRLPSFREIAQQIDPLLPPSRLRGGVDGETEGFINSPVKGLQSAHRWRPADTDSRGSFRAIVDRYSDTAGSSHHLLFYNTWLFDDPREDTALSERAEEIGRTIQQEYDIAGLMEVYDAEELAVIRDQLGDTSQYDDATGVPGWLLAVSAGLVTFCFRFDEDERKIVGKQQYVFKQEGEIFDADLWARKGVLLTRVDVGVGTIEFYTTHMFSGAGTTGGWDYETLRTDVRANEVRLSQVKELLDFVEETHAPENVAIIAGDFNIPASGSHYNHLRRRMNRQGFRDLWTHHGGTVGHTYLKSAPETVSEVCAPGPAGSETYCDDLEGGAGSPDSHRIDYIFVESPTDEHNFNVDLSRMRRRSFWRKEASSPDSFYTDNGPNYLSDHVGLDVAIRTSTVESG